VKGVEGLRSSQGNGGEGGEYDCGGLHFGGVC